MVLLLMILTILAAVILLVALILALLKVLFILQSIRRWLEQVNYGVRAIEKETEMLGGVEKLNDGLTALADGLNSVAVHFTLADKSVGTVGGALLKQ